MRAFIVVLLVGLVGIGFGCVSASEAQSKRPRSVYWTGKADDVIMGLGKELEKSRAAVVKLTADYESEHARAAMEAEQRRIAEVMLARAQGRLDAVRAIVK